MTETPKPSIPVLLTGQMPPPGGAWCATCMMIYMGTISAEPELQQYAIDLHDAAAAAGANFCLIELPERDDLQLQPAITVAPDIYSNVPKPVCWTHIVGFRPADIAAAKARQHAPGLGLIHGKAHRDVRIQDGSDNT